ncbi:mediator complex subunit MED14-domain-containing protein [Aspergillus crustosus]
MPGVVMDRAQPGGRDPDLHDHLHGVTSSQSGIKRSVTPVELQNGSLHTNRTRLGGSRESDRLNRTKAVSFTSEPPGLQHITQGFFPFSKLVDRSVQQCWNDLSDLVNELAEIRISSRNSSPENVQKKLRALEFTQSKRGDFIKLLVLSQWSRQAADVSKLIDIQNFIRAQHQGYSNALQYMGDMKRDLVRAQVANPDLKTALEVLSRGEVTSMPDLGYKSPKPLTPKSTLRKLRKINRIIGARLTLSENIPSAFQTYKVHDGRVTFVVPMEFELDLSIGEMSSQFYFVDIRFLFSPSSSISTGRMFSELDLKVNDKLRTGGLTGCFDWLHNLALTLKINVLSRQATDLARGLWSSVLRVEVLHRTLVLYYWAPKSGPKSWLEIGICSGRIDGHIALRWMRDGRQAQSKDIEFNTVNLSVECLLRSVIAAHISHILSLTFRHISEKLLYSNGSLFLRAHLTKTEPGDCQLDIQLTNTRRLRVALEPMSGAVILAPNPLERADSGYLSTVDDIVSRVGRLRCTAAIEEVESQVKMLGFEPINPRNFKIDARKLFPVNVLRFSFFSHRLWSRNWLLAATSSLDGDNWWVVQIRSAATKTVNHVSSARMVCSTLLPIQQADFSSLADLGHCLSGFLAIYANALFVDSLQFIKISPPLDELEIGSELQVPHLNIRYDASKLPHALQLAVPTGIKKKVFVKDTIRLTYLGFDRHRKVATMVAYGKLTVPDPAYGKLIPKDDLLGYRENDGVFALRLLASPGHPIIFTLLENLQRLECVLSTYETLRQKKMDTLSLSLSHIDFAYGPGKNLLARLEFYESSSSMDLDPVRIQSRTDRLFHLRLGIRFSPSNPHRRIQGPLATSINRFTTNSGLDTVADLLSITLPLMRALGRFTFNPSHNEPVKVHVIVRNAKSYQIHYPLEGWRFQLAAHRHQRQPVWVLKDIPGVQIGAGENQAKHKLHGGLYISKGIGWKGFGNGVVANFNQVGDLLDELDKCLASCRADLPLKTKSLHEAPTTQVLRQTTSAAPQKADIIMID